VTPLHVGLALGGPADAAGWPALLERAGQAEALGLHSVWLPESHFRRGAMASPLLALSAIAARTAHVKLGTTSLLLTVHHPLRVAQETAALDVLSGGRLLLGLGRGFAPALFDGFGVEARSKRDRFDEALDAILEAWAGRPVALAGAHFATREGRAVEATLRPVTQPHPPLFVAAFGRKALEQAARRALAYLASPLEPFDLLLENYALHRELLGDRAIEGPFRVPVMRTVHVAADEAAALRAWSGLEAEARALPRNLPPALARAAAAPPEARAIVGTAAQVADQIARQRERLGIDLLVVRGEIAGLAEDERRASLERLAGEVLPALD
jgi:alkanesulfonate monooxygenase SsuD/methylene tetrahydromethanopterin reductase-like flavin-dependent oxidoreductase (luciferase family)